MKTYLKTIIRSMWTNAARLVSLTIIIFLSITFVTGLGTLKGTIEDSFNYDLVENNVADIIVKTQSIGGFTETEITALSAIDFVDEIEEVVAIDEVVNQMNTRTYYMDFSHQNVNRLNIAEGRLPSSATEVLLDRSSKIASLYNVGDTISYNSLTLTIVGKVENSLLFTRDGELSLANNEELDWILYFDRTHYPYFPTTDLFISMNGENCHNKFASEYQDDVKNIVEEIKKIDNSYVCLTHKENRSSVTLVMYNEKVQVIAMFFPLFFILLTALVVLTTMTRMIEEERSIIGCYKSLGFSNSKVAAKYLTLTTVCTLIASIAGLYVGALVFPFVIYPAFDTLFFLPEMSGYIDFTSGLVAIFVIFTTVTIVTTYVVMRDVKSETAQLLIPKAPKIGGKIFLEKIKPLWNLLSFHWKSTCRNIFRYKKHLFMTVLTVAGSTALVFAGFALADISTAIDSGPFTGISESLQPISVLVIVFALLLSIFVIYNLTNMNICERRRDIATLKVLGYHETEVLSYIYREIIIMSILGIIIGIPLGCGLISFIVNFLGFGNLTDVNIISFLASGVLVLFFILIVDCLLAPKIAKIDMISSLKANE